MNNSTRNSVGTHLRTEAQHLRQLQCLRAGSHQSMNLLSIEDDRDLGGGEC